MADLQDALDATLAGVESLFNDDDQPIEPPEDADQANRMLRAVRYHERKADEVRAVVGKEIARLKQFGEERVAIHAGAVEHLARALEGWTRKTLTGRERTQKLPNGEVRLRPGKVQVATTTDEEAEVAAALAALHPEWVGVEHKLLRQVLGKKDSGVQLGEPVTLPAVLTFLGPAGDGFEWWTATDADGETLAGVALKVPTRDAFGYTTAKLGTGSVLAEDEEAPDAL